MNFEKPAKGVRGFILRDFHGDKYFFRIYHHNESGKITGHTDYDLRTEELEVVIEDDAHSFYESVMANKLDWSQKTLHGEPGDKVVRVNIENGARVETHGHLDKDLKFVPD